jgi:prefoldin subunit 5
MTDTERGALQRDMGRLEARVDAVESELREIKADVKSILALVNQAKGGWKTLVVVGAVAGAAGALVTKLGMVSGFLPR